MQIPNKLQIKNMARAQEPGEHITPVQLCAAVELLSSEQSFI